MPSNDHEVPLDLVQLDPSLPGWLQSVVLDAPLPAFARAELFDPNARPSTFQSDAMVVFRDQAGTVVYAIVFEVQRRRDGSKLATWKIYVGMLEARFGIEATLLALVPDRETAAWYAERIAEQTVSGARLAPRFVTPADVPRILDEETAAAHPAWALFADLCNLGEDGEDGDVDAEDVDEMFPAMIAALAQLHPSKWAFYDDQIRGRLSRAGQARWEAFVMTSAIGGRYRTEVYNEIDAQAEARGRAEGRVEGRVEGRAEEAARLLLALLDKRGVIVSAQARDLVLACADGAQLELWFDRAVTATTIDDVLPTD
jgi:hypothetical protein